MFPAGSGRLDGLDFHADRGKRRENLADIRDDGDSGADGHTKPAAECTALPGEAHDNTDDGGTYGHDDRRIDGIKEIGPLHSLKTVGDGTVVALFIESFCTKDMKRADRVERFRENPASCRVK